MKIVVISNDVTPGFAVPVAAPGLRAAGLAEGLRAHGHSVEVAVPADLLANLFADGIPTPPPHTHVVAPPELNGWIHNVGAEVVVFINSNLTPHLDPAAPVHYVYDLFAPKVLELEASPNPSPDHLAHLTTTKARAMAMADSVWVNGARKLDYARSWLDRPDVVKLRTTFGRGSRGDQQLTLVAMPVPLPEGIAPEDAPSPESIRLGIAGYAQGWSSLDTVHPGHQLLIDRGFELHVLLPSHWGSQTAPPPNALPAGIVEHHGPLEFGDFARWVQSMSAMVDVFRPSPERHYAMITRSAVALRLGVPLIHAVDSEISDIVREFGAGWVLDPDDIDAWARAATELSDHHQLDMHTAGAVNASRERFAPGAALSQASAELSASLRDA